MAEVAIRFTVTNREGQRAASWKCWTTTGKEDVYVTCREVGAALKTSFHESGEWHTAYFQDFYERAMPEADRKKGRFIEQWPRPMEIAPGVTLAFRIRTPGSAITTEAEIPSSVIRIPAPSAEGKAIECVVFLLDRRVSPDGFPGRDSMGTKLVGQYNLPSGGRVCVVWWEINMPEGGLPPMPAKFFRGRSMEDIKGARGRLKMLLFGEEQDGSKVIYDCTVNVEQRDGKGR